MPFVKLDCGILNSTLWIDRLAREIFITALLMAEPRELLDSEPQINIGSLGLTGWNVPPGWYGFVQAAGIGILHRARVDEGELGMAALARLSDPDPDSRSSTYDGRRLVRINGGFIILNFIAYREKDSTTAERSKRWRERQKKKAKTTRVSDTPTHRHRHAGDTIAEAEAEVRTIPGTNNKLATSGSASTTSTAPTRSPLRHGGSIIGRNTHLDHADCDENLCYCVPSAVHNKLADRLSPKYAGDRDTTKDALRAWYREVWKSIPPGTIMGDAFKFWQARFDESFATPQSSTPRKMTTQEMSDAILGKMREAGELA